MHARKQGSRGGRKQGRGGRLVGGDDVSGVGVGVGVGEVGKRGD